MKRADHGVGAVSLGFGREPLHHDADDQSSDRRDDRNQPESVGADDLNGNAPLGRQAGALIPGDADNHPLIRDPEQRREQLREQRAGEPQQHGVEQQPVLAEQTAECVRAGGDYVG
jgi:hypothetical protein